MGFGSLAGGSGDLRTRNRISLYGDKELLWAFDQLPPRLQKKYARRGVTKAGRRIAKAAKQHVPVRSGALKKSLSVKAKTYRKTGTVVAIIGPRLDFQTTYGGKLHIPGKIAHLVEFGHGGPKKGKSWFGKRRQRKLDKLGQGGGAQPHPFLRPAMDETRNLCTTIIAFELELGLRELGREFVPSRAYP